MKYLLDSNIVIMTVLAINPALRRRLAECDEGEAAISVISYAEVAHGSVRGKPPAFDKLQAFVEEIPVIDFDHEAALAYASLPFRRASYDRLIAAHALSRGLVVVTDNISHFADVPGLSVENWARP